MFGTPAGIFNHADPLDLLNNNATTLFPVTGRSETVNRDPTNERVGGNETQTEDGDSAPAGENTQLPLPATEPGNTVTTTVASEQIEVYGTQTEGGCC